MTPPLLPAAAWPPAPDEARRQLRDELARPEYVTTWWSRVRRWFADLMSVGTGEGDLTGALAVGGVLLLALVALVAWRSVRARRAARAAAAAPPGVDLQPGTTAAQYRRRAEEHLRAGRPHDAVLDAYRALAARGAELGVATPAPNRTAGAVAREVAGHRPDLADDLHAAAARFDGVRYGDAPAEPVDALAILGVEQRLGPGVERPRVDAGIGATATPTDRGVPAPGDAP